MKSFYIHLMAAHIQLWISKGDISPALRMIKSDGRSYMEEQACFSHINQGLWMARLVSGSWLFWGPWLGFQCVPEACPFWLAQWGARWRLCSPKSSPRSCVRSDPSWQGGVVGQGPAFVQRRILWPIVRRPQPFRDFKGSFAQFLLSATLSTEQQRRGERPLVFQVKREKRLKK